LGSPMAMEAHPGDVEAVLWNRNDLLQFRFRLWFRLRIQTMLSKFSKNKKKLHKILPFQCQAGFGSSLFPRPLIFYILTFPQRQKVTVPTILVPALKHCLFLCRKNNNIRHGAIIPFLNHLGEMNPDPVEFQMSQC
jgi:hypothetical protein